MHQSALLELLNITLPHRGKAKVSLSHETPFSIIPSQSYIYPQIRLGNRVLLLSTDTFAGVGVCIYFIKLPAWNTL